MIHKHLTVGFLALGGLIALVSYLENRTHNKLKEQIAMLDKEIKTLELHEKLSNG